ncbi:hypothetical protein DFH28DRAFT_968098 [Melampsora americana]|nr:hypothetical protein DFH28DRAFT_968098 [Melampsora americana]
MKSLAPPTFWIALAFSIGIAQGLKRGVGALCPEEANGCIGNLEAVTEDVDCQLPSYCEHDREIRPCWEQVPYTQIVCDNENCGHVEHEIRGTCRFGNASGHSPKACDCEPAESA